MDRWMKKIYNELIRANYYSKLGYRIINEVTSAFLRTFNLQNIVIVLGKSIFVNWKFKKSMRDNSNCYFINKVPNKFEDKTLYILLNDYICDEMYNKSIYCIKYSEILGCYERRHILDTRVPLFINTIENQNKSIGFIGTNNYANNIYEYLKSNCNICVETIDKIEYKEKNIFIEKRYDIVLICDPLRIKHIYDLNKSEVSYINLYEYLLSGATNVYNDIMSSIIDFYEKNGVVSLFVTTPDLERYNHKIRLFLSMGYWAIVTIFGIGKDKYLLKHLHSDEIYGDYKNTKMDNLKGYNRVWGGGVYINYDNGFRRTIVPFEIDENAKNVWLFGNCMVRSPMVKDSDTLISYLQKKLGKGYSVSSRGNEASAMNIVMKDTLYKAGDIVIAFVDKRELKKYSRKINIVDLTETYLKIPRLEKHITDSSMHCDKEVYSRVADCLVQNIKNIEKVKSGKEICFGNHIRRAARAEMFRDIELCKYIDKIIKYKRDGKNGAIVMNCNPFTKGHRYLVEYASKKVDNLYLFVVREDKSFFTFKERMEMVIEGTKDLSNIIALSSDKFMISATTLQGYFDKDHLGNINVNAEYDLELFAMICRYLDITIRFAGKEPFDAFTRKYNDNMKKILPNYGIDFWEIPRLEIGNETVSASKVRKLLQEKKFNEIKALVPYSTYKYLIKRRLTLKSQV